MLSLDSNILLHAYAKGRPRHAKASEWLNSIAERADVVISEFVLAEFYQLIRNPTLFADPLSAGEAVQVIDSYRSHPVWQLVGFSPDSKTLHTKLWKFMATPRIAYGRIFDARLALTLRYFGVTDFATANVKHFQDFGFKKVWNPLDDF